MILFLLACVLSLVPYTALYLWLRGLSAEKDGYRELCKYALMRGVRCVLPVILISATLHILLNLSGIQSRSPLLHMALYNFIVLALSEEFSKYMAFRRVLKDTDHPCSWLDAAVLMTIVGTGFGFLEALIYTVGASIPVVLVRGICLPHSGYGFVVGYFYGKACKTGRPGLKWLGLVLVWFMHGLYDFSLSEEFLAISENLVFIPLLLAALDIAFVIALIRFVKKAKKDEIYTESLFERVETAETSEPA
ncbi:MAG: PrsW family intramembrane metalloprotease [Firmicutes bacterium]|nr:PrsW family intramembrane metalloprotease [Bacillota bacterium]